MGRCIVHVDLDCFYAQVEHVRLNIPLETPLAVQQWSGLIAVNYAARAFGINRHDSVFESKQKCPHLRLVHVATYSAGHATPHYHDAPAKETHKVSLDCYRRASHNIMAILKSFSPNIERASIDEAYLDVSDIIHQRFLSYQKQSADGNEDALKECRDIPDGIILGECLGTDDDDVRLLLTAKLAKEIRDAVWSQLSYTCSAGIASNKTLAKLCSAMNKPNKQTLLLSSGIEPLFKTLPFQKIRLLGGKLGDAVAELKVETAADLWAFSLRDLQAKFGDSTGTWLYNIARGHCSDPVNPRDATKSMLSAKSLSPAVLNLPELSPWITILASELYARLTEDVFDRWPKTLTVQTKKAGCSERRRSVPFPNRTFVCDPNVIANMATNLIKHGKDDGSVFPCERISISCTNFTSESPATTSISKWIVKKPKHAPGDSIHQTPLKEDSENQPNHNTTEKQNATDGCVMGEPVFKIPETIERPFKTPAVPASKKLKISSTPASSTPRIAPRYFTSVPKGTPEYVKAAWTSFPSLQSTPSNTDPIVTTDHNPNGIDTTEKESEKWERRGESDPVDGVLIYPCPKCHDVLLYRDDPDGVQEHMDFHFAQDVAKTMRSEEKGKVKSGQNGSLGKKGGVKKKERGIAFYFGKST